VVVEKKTLAADQIGPLLEFTKRLLLPEKKAASLQAQEANSGVGRNAPPQTRQSGGGPSQRRGRSIHSDSDLSNDSDSGHGSSQQYAFFSIFLLFSKTAPRIDE